MAAKRPPSTSQFFRPVVAPRAFEEVVDQLTHAVRSGYVSVGEKLPTIDELARLMGVSKPTIGEAVKVLVDAKVLRVRRGATGGVEVISQLVPVKALRLSSQRRARRYSELVEARHAIEVELVRLACERATENDLVELESHVRLLDESEGRSAEWERAHLLFHYAIGTAGHSELLAYYHNHVLEEMTLFLGSFPPKYIERDTGIRTHAEIFQALRTHDLDSATRAMKDHLGELEAVAASLEDKRMGGRKRTARAATGAAAKAR